MRALFGDFQMDINIQNLRLNIKKKCENNIRVLQGHIRAEKNKDKLACYKTYFYLCDVKKKKNRF
jgi:hypothetical protein